MHSNAGHTYGEARLLEGQDGGLVHARGQHRASGLDRAASRTRVHALVDSTNAPVRLVFPVQPAPHLALLNVAVEEEDGGDAQVWKSKGCVARAYGRVGQSVSASNLGNAHPSGV